MSVHKSDTRDSLGAPQPAQRPKRVRVTVDLDPLDYDVLRDFAHVARMSHADVMRALVRLLEEPDVAAEVRRYVTQ